MSDDTAVVPQVTVRAPGKINVALYCGRPDASGYHPLATVFQAVELYEDVTASPADRMTVSVSGRGAEQVPLDQRNLAVRAASLLQEVTGTEQHAHLHVAKQVPVGGGMAGGSADAAAALLACNELWRTELERGDLIELAGQLGSDVPFALRGRTAVGSGRGHLLTSAITRERFHWVLALQEEGLSTPDVFADFDAHHEAPEVPRLPDGLLEALSGGSAEELVGFLCNDLQEAAVRLRPELGDVLAAADRGGALAAIISGSGPSVAALALDEQHAESVAHVLRGAEVASDVLVMGAPAAGARVVEAIAL